MPKGKMNKKKKAILVGWIGIVNGKPFFQNTSDAYSEPGKPLTPIADIYRNFGDAKKRFQQVRCIKVFTE